jgi:hypothetical protein
VGGGDGVKSGQGSLQSTLADHRERVIDLLARVARVSVETVRITEAMRALPRD